MLSIDSSIGKQQTKRELYNIRENIVGQGYFRPTSIPLHRPRLNQQSSISRTESPFSEKKYSVSIIVHNTPYLYGVSAGDPFTQSSFNRLESSVVCTDTHRIGLSRRWWHRLRCRTRHRFRCRTGNMRWRWASNKK